MRSGARAALICGTQLDATVFVPEREPVRVVHFRDFRDAIKGRGVAGGRSPQPLVYSWAAHGR